MRRKKQRRAQCHQGQKGSCQEETVVIWNKLEKLHEGENQEGLWILKILKIQKIHLGF